MLPGMATSGAAPVACAAIGRLRIAGPEVNDHPWFVLKGRIVMGADAARPINELRPNTVRPILFGTGFEVCTR